MFPIETFRITIEKIVRILNQLSIPFHLTGGITSVAYGEPRFTQDIDLVVGNEVLASQLGAFVELLSDSDFLFEAGAIRSAIEQEKMFQLYDREESLKLDLYVREMIPGELSRSNPVEIFPQLTLPIVSKVDAAASKLIWISKGSHKSRRDLRQLIRLYSSTEVQQVKDTIEQFGLIKLFEQVLAESDEIIE